jgi:hypothetical protein
VNLSKFLTIVLIITIPFILILGVLRFTALDLGNTETTNNLEHFLKNKKADASYISEFNEVEQEHLYEVKSIMHVFFGILNFALIIYIISMLLLFRLDKENFPLKIGRSFFYGGIASIAVIAVLFLASLNFDWLFTVFHKLLFNTQWQFPSDYLLIQLFPINFFISKFVKIMVISFVSSLIVTAIGFFIKEKYLKKNKVKK